MIPLYIKYLFFRFILIHKVIIFRIWGKHINISKVSLSTAAVNEVNDEEAPLKTSFPSYLV